MQFNVYYDSYTGQEIVKSSLSAVCIALEEYAAQFKKEDSLQKVIEILSELVNLKIMKDEFGKSNHYEMRKEQAWEKAKLFLNKN